MQRKKEGRANAHHLHNQLNDNLFNIISDTDDGRRLRVLLGLVASATAFQRCAVMFAP